MDDHEITISTINLVPLQNSESCKKIDKVHSLHGDRWNLVKLLFLYILQGVPLGFSDAFPILLKSNKFSYYEQAIFSVSTWPFTFKILWAPLVDSIYCPSVERRKMWLVPVHILLGTCLLVCSFYINDWLLNTGESNNVIPLTVVWLIINCLAATQDIVVDGWACSMLKKHNIHYSSMCNATGNSLGSFLGYAVPLLLGSETFCNKWLRFNDKPGGVITIKGYLYFWGIVYIVAAACVSKFKRETQPSAEQKGLGVLNTYKLLWDIVKLPNVQILGAIFLTAKLGFATIDTVTNMEFMEAGVSENNIVIIGILVFLVKLIVPVTITKITNSVKSMDVYMQCVPYRLLHGLAFSLLLYYTPTLLRIGGIVRACYYTMLGCTFITHQIFSFIMYVIYLSFVSKVSDPNFGGTYMTLLCTFANISLAITRTGSLWLVDVLTFKQCTTISQNHCAASTLIKSCRAAGGKCNTIIDGFYAEVIISSILGIIWFYIIKKPLLKLNLSDRKNWLVYKG
ncbi:acetyl-coenzyme A transporter 1-like isoform X1 [Aphis gossypii]|uniref:acetyl-coenzyme A transporter 1-like isoform X1 n=1 Tax=Aphis gossypii TaxID=80765 RepID=UPI0021594344|nr:acetyl-coenzyme A transporter 1-like isoform X1 [Aphis gossypii]